MPKRYRKRPVEVPRRWKLWRIDRGKGAEVWQGAEGPATNPPGDRGLSGTDWIDAAMVEVVEIQEQPDVVESIAAVLFGAVSLEDEDGRPAPREHYTDVARGVFAAIRSCNPEIFEATYEEVREEAKAPFCEMQPPDYAEKDFGRGTSLLAAYRAGYFDAKQDALAIIQRSDSTVDAPDA